jgi:hypothetical protein
MMRRVVTWLGVLVVVAATVACGSKEADVERGSRGQVPEAHRDQKMPPPPAPMGLMDAQGQQAMVEAAKVAAEALQKGELPPPEQMQRLPQAQQEALRKAVEARRKATQ